MIPDPKIALLIFCGLVGLSYLFYSTDAFKWLINRNERMKMEIEDVLKQLYHVEYSGRKASLNAMAGALKINDRRLVNLIEHMSGMGLISIHQNTIALTNDGKDYALRIIRVHRLWEKYLSEKTGIDKSEWHKRAEKMEHRMDEDATEALYQSLGSPRYDPHGDPIPTLSGEIIDTIGQPLSGLSIGQNAKITHLEDEPDVIYKQLLDEKLHMGQYLTIKEVNEHVVTFMSEGREITLSTIVASNVGVKPLTTEEEAEASKIRLSELQAGEKATVVGISRECRGAARRRLMDLGFIKGTPIKTGLNGPMKEPKAYLIKNTLIALRNDQADLILIEKE